MYVCSTSCNIHNSCTYNEFVIYCLNQLLHNFITVYSAHLYFLYNFSKLRWILIKKATIDFSEPVSRMQNAKNKHGFCLTYYCENCLFYISIHSNQREKAKSGSDPIYIFDFQWKVNIIDILIFYHRHVKKRLIFWGFWT